MATIRRIIPAPREPEREKRYFHSDYERHGLAFLRDGKFVFDELYQEPTVIVSRSERIITNQKPRPVVPMRADNLSSEPIMFERVPTRKRRDGLANPGHAQLSKDYIVDELSIYAMTQKYGRSAKTIRTWLELGGIPIREESVGSV